MTYDLRAEEVSPNLTNYKSVISAPVLRRGYLPTTHPLLLHQLSVWAIVYNILAEHRRSQRTVDLLCAQVFQLPIQNKFVPFSAQTHCRLPSEQYKGKDIAVLIDTWVS